MKRKTDNFNKFFNRKRNSAIKEEFKQEKKAAKKERKEAIERHFEEKRRARGQQEPDPRESRFAGKGKGSIAGAPRNPKAGGSPNRGGAAPDQRNSGNSRGAAGHSNDHDQLPLNKYIAHGGVCSRRDAAELIRLGKVTVNGQLVVEPGTKVSPTDLVNFNGKKVTISRNFVYILLNKPKDYITTTEDPQGRKTVLDLIRQATTERVFPVGRLDRNTSGVLLLTNDGDLAQKLAHPKHEIKKIYHVTLDKPLTRGDFDQIINGAVTLEDGPAVVDVLAYADTKDKTQIGLEIHSGRNRIVRRIFEHLGYDVRGLDRVTYAGLTKKNVQRGKWRLLSEKEIRILKYLNASFKGSPGKGAKATLRDMAAQAEAAPRGKANAAKADDDDDIDLDWDTDSSSDADDSAFIQPKAAAQANASRFKKLPGKAKLPFRERPEPAEDSDRSEKPPYRGKPAGGGKRSFGDKPPYRGGKPSPEGKRSFRDKPSSDHKRDKPSSERSDKPASDRPVGKRSFGDKPPYRGGKPSPEGKRSFREAGPSRPKARGAGGFQKSGSQRPGAASGAPKTSGQKSPRTSGGNHAGAGKNRSPKDANPKGRGAGSPSYNKGRKTR